MRRIHFLLIAIALAGLTDLYQHGFIGWAHIAVLAAGAAFVLFVWSWRRRAAEEAAARLTPEHSDWRGI